MRDNKSNLQMVLLGTISLSGTTPGASSWVDTRGFDAASLVLKTGTVTDAGTAAGFTFTAQHSDTTAAADAAAIATTDAVGGVNSLTVVNDTDDDKVIGAVGYIGAKRYVRLNGVGTTGTAATVDVYAVLSKPAAAPTTFAGTAVAAT